MADDYCENEKPVKRRHAVMVEQDWRFWTEEFAHRWRWPCVVAAWWGTRTPGSRWAGRNVEVRTDGK